MNHELLRVFAQYLVYFVILFLPILIVLYTDRFRQNPTPDQYAVLLAMVAAIGVLVFVPAITITAATALAALGIAWLSGRYALARVSFERTLEPARLFPGDRAELTLRIENRKLLPLAWLSLVDPVHHGMVRPGKDLTDLLEFSGSLELLDNLGHAVTIRTAVAPFQTLSRTYSIKAQRRGVYGFGAAIIDSGDPFGIFPRSAVMGRRQELIVYPSVHRPEELGLPFREAMGNAASPRALVEDPILLAGSREYHPGDPLNRVHWKATARTGGLQVRIADPSTTARLMLVLNLNTFQHVWQGVDLDRMESTIDIAASVSLWALDKGFAVGVRSNGVVPGMEIMPRLAASAHPQQPTAILEHLARLSFSGRFSAENVLDEEAGKLQAGSSILFVTSIITPELISILTSRRLIGRVSVVYSGRFAAPVVRGVPIYLASPPREAIRAVS